MPNVDRPYGGLKPIGSVNGAPYNGQVRMYLIPAADNVACFIGDLVKPYTAGGAAGTVVYGQDVEGMPTCVQAAAGDPCLGVVVGFLPDPADLTKRHRVASTNRIALVVDDLNALFEAQEVSGGTAWTAAEVGLNANVVVGSGNATTGLSAMELNNATEATDAGLNVRLLGLVKRPDNAYGEHAKWIVKLMDHSLAPDAAGV